MSINQKIRIKCKELVKNVGIYKDKLAAHLNEKVLIYVSTTEDQVLKYKLYKKINKKIDCTNFAMVSNNFLMAFQKKI